MKQQLDYGIFVIEQVGNRTFNRGALLNIGFVEAIKTYNYTCFVFHDVDLIPQDDRIYYGCGTNPRHLSAAMDKYNYSMPYKSYIGGVTQLPRKTIEHINGFSNLYFGWGAEDDDLGYRMVNTSYKIERYSMKIARYRMFKHTRDKFNQPNPERTKLLETSIHRMKTDGINSLKYKLLSIEQRKLYTNISVEVRKEDYGLCRHYLHVLTKMHMTGVVDEAEEAYSSGTPGLSLLVHFMVDSIRKTEMVLTKAEADLRRLTSTTLCRLFPHRQRTTDDVPSE